MKATIVAVTTCCEHVLSVDSYHNSIRCAALATPGSRYCPVHAATQAVVPRPKPPVRDPDADVLPWQADDLDIFEEAREREEARAPRRGRRQER